MCLGISYSVKSPPRFCPMKLPQVSCVLIGALAIGVSLAASPESVKTVESAPRDDCLLFVGAQLKVKDEQGWHKVVGVEPGAFLTMEQGEMVRLPMDRPGFEFSLERVPRITMQEVRLADRTLTPAYTPARDPRRRWLDNQNLAMSNASDDLNAATRHLRGQIAAQAQVDRLVNSAAGAGAPQAVVEQITSGNVPDPAGALQGLEAAAFAQGSDQFNPALYDRMAHEAGEGKDALRIEGTLEAESALENPYAVVFVTFSLPGEDLPRHRVFAEALPALAAGERHEISLMKGGFPPGYELGKVQLHFFENGREIASPESERRTPLSWDDALQFVVLERVARQRKEGEAMAAGVLPELVRAEDRAAWMEQGRSCFVKVEPTGRPEGVFADAAGQRPLGDPNAEALIRRMAFRPAVSADGVAVETMLRLEPGDLQTPDATL